MSSSTASVAEQRELFHKNMLKNRSKSTYEAPTKNLLSKSSSESSKSLFSKMFSFHPHHPHKWHNNSSDKSKDDTIKTLKYQQNNKDDHNEEEEEEGQRRKFWLAKSVLRNKSSSHITSQHGLANASSNYMEKSLTLLSNHRVSTTSQFNENDTENDYRLPMQ